MAAPIEVLERVGRPSRRASSRKPPRRLALAAAIVAAAALLPVVYLVVRAASSGAHGIAEILFTAELAGLIGRTVALAATVTATSVAIAVPLAWLTERTDLPGRRVWVVISALPLVIPSFVGAYALLASLSPKGLVQGWLAPLGVQRLPSIYGFTGAWFALSLFTYPLALLPIRAALKGLDPALEEASRALGRTRRSTLFHITLPQLRPAIVSGGLLVALYTMSDFGAVGLLRFDSLAYRIFVAYRSDFNRAHAALLGLVLVVMTITVLAVEARTRGRAVYNTGRSRRRPSPPVQLRRWRWPAAAVCAALVALALVIPVGVICIWLFRGIASGVTVGLAFAPALHSMEASFFGAVAVVVCAWPVAFISARYSGRLARFAEAASYVGYALPGIVIALAFVFLGVRIGFLYQTLPWLVFAYTVHFLPLATGTLRTSIVQVPPGVEEAARSLGASSREVLRRILLPLVRPGVLTAFALVFLTVMKELPATLLLAPAGFRTLATDVWDPASAGSFANAALPALALILLSSAPMALLVAREQRRSSTVY